MLNKKPRSHVKCVDQTRLSLHGGVIYDYRAVRNGHHRWTSAINWSLRLKVDTDIVETCLVNRWSKDHLVDLFY